MENRKQPIGIILTDLHLKEDNVNVVRSIVNQTIKYCLDNQIQTIINAGDSLHSRKSQSQSVLTAFESILDDIWNAGLKMVSIVGNHDRTDYNSKESFISPFKHHPGLLLYETYGLLQLGKANIAFLSFFNDTIYNQYLQSLIEEVDTAINDEECALITHIGVSGAKMNNGTLIESEVGVKLFDRFKAVKIGHYHDPQQFDHIEYIGAAMQHNFGEGTQKGATVIYDDLSTELVPFVFPQYLTYEVDVKSMTTKDIEDLKVEKQQSQDYIRVTLKGAEKDLKAFNKQSLEAIGIKVQLEQEKIDIVELETRCEAFDSKTLTEEFEVFCKKNKLNHKEGLKYFNQIVK